MPLLSNMELRGALLNARESVITVLRSRFGEVPTEFTETINNIQDLFLLKQLLSRAVTVNSLAEFQQFITVE